MAVSIRGGGSLFEQGYGCRDADGKFSVDCDTVFGVASMSKSMTALACAILHVEGRLSLSDPLCKYFPDVHIPGIPDECITLRDVLMHRSGLPPLGTLEWSVVMNSREPDSRWSRYVRETAPNQMNTIEQVVSYISDGNYTPLGCRENI
ncbi:MAG: serine hydrolase domain-containing protein [Eubacterium sp.]